MPSRSGPLEGSERPALVEPTGLHDDREVLALVPQQ
jgi:hypothetical protein